MGKRSYGEACGIPRALDRIGERWALMVVRELLLGPKRFTDLREGLPHMSADVLAQRLRELEENGIVERRVLPPPAASKVYELTDWGRELESVLIALGRWGARAPLTPDCSEMSLDSHIVSLQTLFDPTLAGDFAPLVELRLGEHVFHVQPLEGRLDAGRGPAAAPDVVIATDPCTLLALTHRQLELADAIAAGDAEVTGDKRAARRFLRLFPLPEPARPQEAVA
ncbi:MAG TPA: winged helix-turn-helix transcriptional regulator [Solirubrobacterales bacterium]|nr:winged helix-turn-helix transcriptional regulator [Solirubrobacterales bacterium]